MNEQEGNTSLVFMERSTIDRARRRVRQQIGSTWADRSVAKLSARYLNTCYLINYQLSTKLNENDI